MRLRAVFLDAGHTLLRAHPDLGGIYTETTAALGAQVSPARFAEAFIPVFRDFTKTYALEGAASDAQDYAMWREITRRIYGRIPELGAVAFDAWFEALYRRFGEAGAWRFYDDVEPVLRKLRDRGLRLGVVSNWDTRLRGICAGLGLDRLVDFIVISAEVGVRKPDPRIFHAALEKAGVSASEALHVGDLPDEDVAGARAAGIAAVLIDRAQRITPPSAPPGVGVVRGLEDLLDMIK